MTTNLPKPLADVIIPCYNYADKIHVAINSVKNQTLSNFACYIVNDGSTDNSEQVIRELIKDDARFHYVYQNNAGVANARNNGVFRGEGVYVCCLDADDKIAPEYLETCVTALEEDPSIDIAYTGLWFIKPNGSEGLSPWPTEFNYDDALTGKNQIPTCNVARRIVWERLGGQRQRYAPRGAGEEDAEMWLRAGAYGFNAKKVTEAGLFIYSWLSGRVSGNKEHEMTDYRGWHPWVKDNRHPFASLASPENRMSHPVRQYDEPAVSVIIPVGKGHETEVINALDSLDAQTYRNWEAIVIWDMPKSDDIDRALAYINNTFPYIKLIETNEAGGAGKARNLGAKIARAPFLFFLDADDWLYPEALDKVIRFWEANEGIIYTDYVGMATIELDGEYFNRLVEDDKLLYYNEKTENAVISFQSAEYNCLRAINQPSREMYVWCLISSLVPKVWYEQIGGFDENLQSWEDWDFFIRLAKAGKCFYRLPEQLVVYRFQSGHRREIGEKQHEDLIKYLLEKYEDIETMPCGCKGSRNAPTTTQNITPISERKVQEMSDDDFVMVVYDHPNRGQHRVIGSATKTDYGYRAGGDRFYVHKADIATAPHIYKPIAVPAPPPTDPTVPPPPPVASKLAEQVESVGKEEETKIEDVEDIPASEPIDLQLVAGISNVTAQQLNEFGIFTVQDLIAFGERNLERRVKGIGKSRAKAIIESATAILENSK